jgi:hypothetical protein
MSGRCLAHQRQSAERGSPLPNTRSDVSRAGLSKARRLCENSCGFYLASSSFKFVRSSDKEIDGAAIGFEQAVNLVPLCGGGAIERDTAGSAQRGLSLYRCFEAKIAEIFSNGLSVHRLVGHNLRL